MPDQLNFPGPETPNRQPGIGKGGKIGIIAAVIVGVIYLVVSLIMVTLSNM